MDNAKQLSWVYRALKGLRVLYYSKKKNIKRRRYVKSPTMIFYKLQTLSFGLIYFYIFNYLRQYWFRIKKHSENLVSYSFQVFYLAIIVYPICKKLA